jgi:hypothetical protein
MRVLLNPRNRDDSGAIAVVVALLLVTLVGLSAFTADLGVAYVNKRQLQTAADAAALGAAGVYASGTSTNGCSGMLSSRGTAALAEATSKVAVNDNDAAPATPTFDPACVNGALRVRVKAAATSPSFFGRVFGRDNYPVDRSATAVISVAGSVGAGLRPMALCSRDLLTLTTFPSPVMKFEGPSEGGGNTAPVQDCPDTMNPGNWWTLRCPSSNDNLAYNLTYGCRNPVSIVPGQPAPSDPSISSHLLNYCANPALHPEACLTSDPGNMRDSGSLDALRALVDREETFFLPAFCGTPTCNPGAVSVGGGSNTIYPVFRLIGVRLCGYHFGNGSNGSYQKTNGSCATTTFNASTGGNQRNYILVSVQQVNVSGPIVNTGCSVGAPCDTGLRQVAMTG